MPTTLTERPAQSMSPHPRRKLWTRAECEALEAAGLLEGQHLELIEGELIDKMGKNLPHVVLLRWLVDWLKDVFGKEFVYSESPIDVATEDNPTSEPEPDIIVLNQKLTTLSRRPRAEDLHLIVEVADTTLGFDTTIKAALYARGRRDNVVSFWFKTIISGSGSL